MAKKGAAAAPKEEGAGDDESGDDDDSEAAIKLDDSKAMSQVTDEYVKSQIEANKVNKGDTSSTISTKITAMKQLVEDLTAKAEHAASVQQWALK